jgi:hypothetical protein
MTGSCRGTDTWAINDVLITIFLIKLMRSKDLNETLIKLINAHAKEELI